MPTDDEERLFGVQLRGGLPKSNGLAPLAQEFVESPAKVTFGVFSVTNATTTVNNENGTQTASMKLIGLEADLLPAEIAAVQLVLDRARVRRTGESPLFNLEDMPADPAVVVRDPKARPLKSVSTRRGRG